MSRQTSSPPKQITDWVRKEILPHAERLLIRTKHIEQDRRWRQITAADVRHVLDSGQATQVRSSDQTVFWQGHDSSGRLLELECSMVSEGGYDTILVKDAQTFRVGTAYDPTVEDEQVRNSWLKDHPEYGGDSSAKKVIRKIQRH